MTALAIKKEIHKAIDNIESEQILKAVYMILNEELKHEKNKVKPFTIEEFYARNNQSQREIKQGKLIDHKAIKKKIATK